MPKEALTWQIALGVHIFAWIVQFYGHGVHEGRAPALLDSLLQSVLMVCFTSNGNGLSTVNRICSFDLTLFCRSRHPCLFT